MKKINWKQKLLKTEFPINKSRRVSSSPIEAELGGFEDLPFFECLNIFELVFKVKR